MQVLGNLGDGAAGAFLPGRVGGGVHHHPADGPPAGVVRLAAIDEEMGERFGQDDRPGLRAVVVEMTQGRPHAPPVANGARQLRGAPAGPGL